MRVFATFVLLLVLIPDLAIAAPDAPVPAGDEPVDAADAEFDEIEGLRKKAQTEGEWAQSKDEQIAVDAKVLTKTWNKVPFDTKAFDYSPEYLRDNWGRISNLYVPYPSAQLLRDAYSRYPQLRASHKDFDGDYEKLERELVNVWRLWFRGDFQAAMVAGEKLGVMGRLPGKVSQTFYAVYLEPDLPQKHMLLQDAANSLRESGQTFDQMKRDKEASFRDLYVAARLNYLYAIGRTAEDLPIPVMISRNYVFKVLGAADDVSDVAPSNPLGIAARAGIDANVVRKVGKATGRMTFGAKQSNVRNDFQAALKAADLAVIRYEYANALLYLNKKRDIDEAMEELRRAASTRPRFAMEALDAMYASKRLREVEALSRSTASFRSFERKRLRYQKEHNENLYCVLPDRCKPFLIE